MEHFRINWQYDQWVKVEDQESMLNGSLPEWTGTWGIWDVDYGIMPDFYYQESDK